MWKRGVIVTVIKPYLKLINFKAWTYMIFVNRDSFSNNLLKISMTSLKLDGSHISSFTKPQYLL